MNIAILMPLAEQRGGAEQLLRELMPRTRDADGITWQVIFFEEGPLQEELDRLGIKTHVLQTGRLREITRYVAAVRRLVLLLRQQHVDLVFSWMAKAHLYGSPAAWLAGLPALWCQHGLSDTPGLLDRLVTLLPARGVVACSEAAARAQRRLRPVRPTLTAHPCVNLDLFDPGQLPAPAEARQRLGLPEAGPLIGIVGRLQRWKGIHVLVDALPAILEAYPDAHCVVVGGRHDLEPGYEDELEAQIIALGLEDRITFAGFQRNVPEWMQAMDVVVHASDREPFGMVVIEAMALGKPVIAGADGGPREIITEGVDGLFAPYGDAEALAGQILRFLDDPVFMHTAGEAARNRALDFSPEHYAQRLLACVEELTGTIEEAKEKKRESIHA